MTKNQQHITILIGSDHGGFGTKQSLVAALQDRGYEVIDCGAKNYNPDDDYPSFAFKVGEELVKLLHQNKLARGILLCRSGAGMNVAANKVNGVRAAETNSIEQAQHARRDNDANIATIAADWLDIDAVLQIVSHFINTQFSGEERHIRRINQISAYEKNN